MPEDTPAPSVGKSDDNLIAAVSYLWILSIIILLVKKDSDYVRFHAKQGGVLFGVSVVLWVLGFMPLLWPILMLLNLAIFVAIVIGFINAIQGKRYKMPVVGDLAEKVNL